MMRFFLTLFIPLLACPSVCLAQLDTTYIAQYKKPTAISFNLDKNYLMGVESKISGTEVTYEPNNPFSVGLGLSVYNTVVSFGYSRGFDGMMNDKEKGKTTATDFQFHKYGRKFVFDVYYQKYKGFYQEDSKEKLIAIYPDMTMNMYSAQGQYVFNNKKFSAPAAFNRSEKQLKSAGSFLAGFGVYQSKIQSDSIFTDSADEIFRNFQFGVNGGYVYSWVISRRWIMSGAVSVGVNIGGESIGSMWNNMRVYPTASARVGTAYTLDNWSIGMSYVNNISSPSFHSDRSFILSSGNLQLNYTLRLGPIPVISKVVYQIDKIMGWTRK